MLALFSVIGVILLGTLVSGADVLKVGLLEQGLFVVAKVAVVASLK